MRVTRRAGIKQAPAATSDKTNDTVMKVSGSVGGTPYKKLDSNRLRMSATIMPKPNPIDTTDMPCHMTNLKTLT